MAGGKVLAGARMETRRPKEIMMAKQTDTKSFITIVSGSPRSGTSMMMQMLEAGGLPVFVDTDMNARPPDEFNPHGYYEHRFTAALIPQPPHILQLLRLPISTPEFSMETAWLAEVCGKAVKVFYDGLPKLPLVYEYRIIIMVRPMFDVLASMTRMCRGQLPSLDLEAQYTKHRIAAMDWLQAHPAIQTIMVTYADVLRSPLEQSVRVQQFLDLTLDTSLMAAVVEPIS